MKVAVAASTIKLTFLDVNLGDILILFDSMVIFQYNLYLIIAYLFKF